MEKNTVHRYDRGEIRNVIKTPEGFLVVDAIVTRTGVFNYLNKDGSIRRELRHPDEVLKRDSLRSMQMLPMTLLHPQDKEVNSKNFKSVSVGFTGEKVEPDGKFIRSKLKVTDESAINAIENGMQELSLGYSVVLVYEPGTFDGEDFDARQTEINYNHLAIVPSARAGNAARIVLDANDAIQDSKNTTKQEDSEVDKLVKINLDGISYDAAPEVQNALNRHKQRADEAEQNLKTVKDEKSSIQAKLDATSEELQTLKNKDTRKDVADAVKARLSLERIASNHLDEETVQKFDSFEDGEIKALVIKKYSPDVKLDDKDEAYVNARFDAAVEMHKNDNDGLNNVRSQMNRKNDNADGNTRVDAAESRKGYIKNLTSNWKPEKANA